MEFETAILQYGLEIALIAMISIFLVGCFKVVFRKLLDKLDKKKRKPIYETLSIIYTYVLAAGWLAIKVKIGWTPELIWQDFLKLGSISYAVAKIMYPLYENYLLRDLVRAVLASIFNIFTKKPKEEVKEGEEKTNDVIVL